MNLLKIGLKSSLQFYDELQGNYHLAAKEQTLSFLLHTFASHHFHINYFKICPLKKNTNNAANFSNLISRPV